MLRNAYHTHAGRFLNPEKRSISEKKAMAAAGNISDKKGKRGNSINIKSKRANMELGSWKCQNPVKKVTLRLILSRGIKA